MRSIPSREWLARSKQEMRVPEHFEWTWCANWNCLQVVWYDPAQKRAADASNATPLFVCSAQCALAAIRDRPPSCDTH